MRSPSDRATKSWQAQQVDGPLLSRGSRRGRSASRRRRRTCARPKRR
jgi:hypothetical protein